MLHFDLSWHKYIEEFYILSTNPGISTEECYIFSNYLGISIEECYIFSTYPGLNKRMLHF